MTPAEHREAFRDGWNGALEEAMKTIPTTWLDPMLTGDKAVLRPNGDFTCPDIEALFRAMKARIETLREGSV